VTEDVIPPAAAIPDEPVQIPADRVLVWVVRLAAGHLGDAVRRDLSGGLDHVALARVKRYRREEDRDRGLAAHAVLRRLLGSVVGAPPRDLVLGTWCAACGSAEHGKPFLTGWGDVPPVQFNVSHSGELVAIALAGPAWEVGVDVESRSRTVNWHALRRSVFADAEWQDTAASADPARARTDAWSRKEACVKATGHGLATSLRSVLITTSPPDPVDQSSRPGPHGQRDPHGPQDPVGRRDQGSRPDHLSGSWQARIGAVEGKAAAGGGDAGRRDGRRGAEVLTGWDVAGAAGVQHDHSAAIAVRPRAGSPSVLAPSGRTVLGPGVAPLRAPQVRAARF
jgi:4'-phosphopantetheinyl transferase